MKRSAALCLAFFPFLLAGCMTMRRSGALTVTPEPGAAKVTVAADAVAKCYNLILVELCSLDLQMRQVGKKSAQSPQAQKIRGFILARHDQLVGELASGRGEGLAALLDLLQLPQDQRVEAILKMKEFDIRAGASAPDFAALVIDNLLKFQ